MFPNLPSASVFDALVSRAAFSMACQTLCQLSAPCRAQPAGRRRPTPRIARTYKLPMRVPPSLRRRDTISQRVTYRLYPKLWPGNIVNPVMLANFRIFRCRGSSAGCGDRTARRASASSPGQGHGGDAGCADIPYQRITSTTTESEMRKQVTASSSTFAPATDPQRFGQ